MVESVYDWAKQQWLTHFFQGDQRPDIRAVMLPLFPELRFLALTATEFVQGPIAWKIFTDAGSAARGPRCADARRIGSADFLWFFGDFWLFEVHRIRESTANSERRISAVSGCFSVFCKLKTSRQRPSRPARRTAA